jgi:hypothetical protein
MYPSKGACSCHDRRPPHRPRHRPVRPLSSPGEASSTQCGSSVPRRATWSSATVRWLRVLLGRWPTSRRERLTTCARSGGHTGSVAAVNCNRRSSMAAALASGAIAALLAGCSSPQPTLTEECARALQSSDGLAAMVGRTAIEQPFGPLTIDQDDVIRLRTQSNTTALNLLACDQTGPVATGLSTCHLALTLARRMVDATRGAFEEEGEWTVESAVSISLYSSERDRCEESLANSS